MSMVTSHSISRNVNNVQYAAVKVEINDYFTKAAHEIKSPDVPCQTDISSDY